MSLNIHAGSMRHVVQWYKRPEGSDNYGQPFAPVAMFTPVMANVRYTSGGQQVNIGAELTDEAITVLTWFDPRIDNSYHVMFNGKLYEVQHVKPDEQLRGMVVTAKVNRNG